VQLENKVEASPIGFCARPEPTLNVGKNWDPFLTFGIQSFRMTAFFSIHDE
jgi:hypothetical protein